MKALLFTVTLVLFATMSMDGAFTGIGQLAQAGEREGQDPDSPGEDALPGNAEAGERVGNDPDVPGGDVPGTPVSGAPGERIGNDPDVPVEGGPVR